MNAHEGVPLTLITDARARLASVASIEEERRVRERNEVLQAVEELRGEFRAHVRGHARMGWLQSSVVVTVVAGIFGLGMKYLETRTVAQAVPPAALAAQDAAYRQLSEDVRHVQATLTARQDETDRIARAVADEVERRELQRPIQIAKRR